MPEDEKEDSRFMNFKLSKTLREEFVYKCRMNRTTARAELIKFIEDYVRSNNG